MALPMIVIANCYRRLNLWNANCGAAFEWVGRVINPYVGFLTGWLMIMGGIIGTVSTTVVLGPTVLAVFGSTTTAIVPNLAIDTVVLLGMLVIAIIGIRLTARTQVGMGLIEYTILIGFAIVGLIAVISHRHGTFPITKGWFSLSGIGGHGSLTAGFLVALFAYTGWDGTVYVNEEVKHRRVNPGKAAMMAVAFLAIVYTVTAVGLQGVVSPGKLQANSTDALPLRRPGAGRQRLGQGHGVLPGAVGDRDHRRRHRARCPGHLRDGQPPGASAVPRQREPPVRHPRRREPGGRPDPARADLGLPALHLAGERLQRRHRDHRPAVRGLLHPDGARRHHLLLAPHLQQCHGRGEPWRAPARLPPGSSAGSWSSRCSLPPSSQIWSLVAIIGVGVVLMLVARVVLRPQFFHLRRETEGPLR